MSRLFLSGWEAGNILDGSGTTTTTEGSWDSVTGGSFLSAAAAAARTGSYGLRVNMTSAASHILTKVFRAASLATDCTISFAFQLKSFANTSEWQNVIYTRDTAGLNSIIRIKMESGPVYSMKLCTAGGTDVGSSWTFTADEWHHIQMCYVQSTHTMTVYLDGVSKVSGALDAGYVYMNEIGLGPSVALNGYGEWYIDDLVVTNTSSYFAQTSILMLTANGNGDNSGMGSRGGTDSGSDYGQVSEMPPNDVTSYYVLPDNNDIMDVTLSTVSGIIDTGATIHCVAAMSRTRVSSSAGSATLVHRIKGGATWSERSSIAVSGDTNWHTNGDPSPRTPYILELNPDDSQAWETADLESLQIGAKAPDAAPDVWVTALWALIEFTPPTTVDVALDLLALTAAPLDLTISAPLPTVTVALDLLTMTAAPLDLTIGKGARAIVMDALAATAAPLDLTIGRGTRTLTLDCLSASLSPMSRRGLIAAWQMEEDQGNSRVDTVGSVQLYEYDVNAPRSTEHKRGRYSAGQFSANHALIALNDDLPANFPAKGGTAPFTFAIWFYMDSNTTDRTVFNKDQDGGDFSLQFKISGSKWYAKFAGQQIEGPPLAVDTWHHAAFTYDGTTWRMYWNGAFDEAKAATGPTSTEFFTVGVLNYVTWAEPFAGYVDEIIVYDRALSDAEVRALYYGGEPGLPLTINANILLDKLALVATVHDVTPPTTVLLDSLALTAAPLDLTIGRGSRAIELDALAAVATPLDLTISRGARALELDALTLAAAPLDLTIGRGARAVELDALAAVATPLDLTISRGAVAIILDKLRLDLYPVRPAADTGLLALWRFEEPAGELRRAAASSIQLREDAGSIPRTATHHEGEYAVGPFSTSFLNTPDAQLPATFPGKSSGSNAPFTIGFWCYWTGSAADQQLLTKGGAKIEAWKGTPDAILSVYVGGKQQSSSVLSDNTWHHVVILFDGSTLYGVFDNDMSVGVGSVGAFQSSSELVVGGYDLATHTAPWDQGYIDELFVYDRALSTDEIDAIYHDGFLRHQIIPGARAIALDALALTASPKAITIDAGAIAPTVVELDALALTGAAKTLDIGQTILPDCLTLAATPLDLTIARGARAVELDPLSATATPLDLTIARGARAVELDALSATVTPLDLTIAGGARAVELDPLAAVATPLDLTISRGARAIELDPLAATATPLDLTLGQTIILDALALSATPLDLTIGRGARAVELDRLTLAGTAYDLVLGVLLDRIVAAATPLDLTIGKGPRSLELDALAAATTPLDLTIGRGARAVELDALAATSTPLDLTIGVSARAIELDCLTLTGAAADLTIARGARAIELDRLALAGTAQDLVLGVLLDRLTASLSALQVSIVAARVIELDKLAITTAAHTLTISAARTIDLDRLQATATAIPLILGLPLDRLELAASVKAVTVAPGPKSQELDALGLTLTAKPLEIAIGVVLDLPTMTTAALDLTIAVSARAIELDRLILAAAPLDLVIARAEKVLPLDLLGLTATPLDLVIARSGTEVALDCLPLTVTALVLGEQKVELARLMLGLTALDVWPIRPTRPAGRTILVPHEDRTVRVPFEELMEVLQEPRGVAVEPE